MNFDDIRQSRWLLPAVAGAVVLVLALVIGMLSRSGEDTATFAARSVPGDLTLTLDGATVDANGETAVKTGAHTVVARRNGFAEQTHTFTIAKDQTYTLTIYLDPSGPEGRQWYDDHPDEELAREAAKGKEFRDTGKKIAAKYPILAELPFLGPGFKIDYGQSKLHPDDPTSVALYIKVIYPSGRKFALDWLKSKGVDPATMEIIWTS